MSDAIAPPLAEGLTQSPDLRRSAAALPASRRRMKIRYGVNQADECRDFAIGPDREKIWRRLRAIDTRMVRLFVFDKQAPDPVTEWRQFASYIDAVLAIDAVPMLTFGKLTRPFGDPRAIRSFANQCADVVWNCLEEWGADRVKRWHWCVLNEPNNAWISGGLTFEHYKTLYEAVAEGAERWLTPHLKGQRPLIGGPAVEGFPQFWWDWPWRFVNEIDNRLIGFVDWHRYADWRACGENGAPADEARFRGLMMSQALDFEFRARAMSELIAGRGMQNICGELNLHSHYTTPVREHFNYSAFAAAFYAASILHLIRGDADVEMYWTGTEESGGYGLMDRHGEPRPAYHAKTLVAQYIRYGNDIWFPERLDCERRDVDVAVASDDTGRLSALLVHKAAGRATYSLKDWDALLEECTVVLKIDEATGNTVVERSCDGRVTFDGYGVAVATTHTAINDTDGQVVGFKGR